MESVDGSDVSRKKWEAARNAMYNPSGPLSRFTPFAENNKLYNKFKNEVVKFLQVLNDNYIAAIASNEPPLLVHREAA